MPMLIDVVRRGLGPPCRASKGPINGY